MAVGKPTRGPGHARPFSIESARHKSHGWVRASVLHLPPRSEVRITDARGWPRWRERSPGLQALDEGRRFDVNQQSLAELERRKKRWSNVGIDASRLGGSISDQGECALAVNRPRESRPARAGKWEEAGPLRSTPVLGGRDPRASLSFAGSPYTARTSLIARPPPAHQAPLPPFRCIQLP